jgi:hypothetical protein
MSRIGAAKATHKLIRALPAVAGAVTWTVWLILARVPEFRT